jgi:hypothetical protein
MFACRIDFQFAEDSHADDIICSNYGVPLLSTGTWAVDKQVII